MSFNADSTCLIFTPTPGYTGTTNFTYTVCDEQGNCSVGTVTVTVITDTNNPPIIGDDFTTIVVNTTTTICVLANDSDPEGGELSIVSITQPLEGGTVSFNADSTCLIFTPTPGYTGTTNFTYTVCDEQGNCSVGTVTVTVITDTNNPPIIGNDFTTIIVNTTTTICVLANDSDPEGGELTIVSITQPIEGGTVSFNEDSTCLVFTPTPGYIGTIDFTYTVCDEQGNCSVGTVTVTVITAGSPPVAIDDLSIISDGNPVTIDVTENDFDPDGDPFAIVSFTQPLIGGTVTFSPDSLFLIFTPNPGYVGVSSFTYTICDDDGCDEATVTINVGGSCDNPTFVCTGLMESVQVCVDFCTLTGAVSITEAHTTFDCGLQIFEDVTCLQYTPLPGFFGGDVIEIIGCDDAGNCETVNVEILVTDDCVGQTLPEPPTAVDDFATTEQGTPITIAILSNDYDNNIGDIISLTAYLPASNGTLQIIGNQFVYTPNPGFFGVDTFYYQICDQTGLCDEGMVVITVSESAEPCGEIQSYVCTEPLSPTVVCTDFCEIEGTPGVELTDVSATFNCSIVLLEDLCFQYTPLPGYIGQDTLTVTGCNAAGECETIQIHSFIDCAQPIANDDTATAFSGGATPIDVMANDLGLCVEDMTVTITIAAENGVAFVDENGQVIYTPNDGFSGIDQLTYMLCNPCSEEACDPAVVTITVVEGGDPVDAEPDVIQTPYETVVAIDVLVNDSGNNLTINEFTQPSFGVVNQDGNMLVYSPAPGFIGTDYFFYTVCDSETGICDETIVSVTVLAPDAVNLPPNVNNDVVVTTPGTSINIDVLINDSDPEGGTLTVVEVTQPDNGLVVIEPDGTITYSPAPGFVGVDVFTYVVCDNGDPQECTTGTVSVSVNEDGTISNNAPIAVDDEASTPIGIAITIDVTFNDSDPDDDLLIVYIGSEPMMGDVEVVGNDVVYTPDDGAVGTDYFTYILCDDGTPVLCDTAFVTVNLIDSVAQAPIANTDEACAIMNNSVTINMLENDVDVNGEAIVITSVSEPSNGELLVDELDLSEVIYLPVLGFTGVDSFTYEVCDLNDMCSTGTVYVYVMDEAIANPDIAHTNEDQAVAIEVLANDVAQNGTVAAIIEVADNGDLTINLDGTITYTPDAGFFGIDYFIYEVCDCAGNCDQSIVGVEVLSALVGNLPPVAGNDIAVTDVDTPIEIDVLANDVDPNGDPLVITQITEQPDGGMVTISADGQTVTFIPDPGFFGCTIFAYEVCDNFGLCDTAYVGVGIGTDTCLNQHPIAVDDFVTTGVELPVLIDMLDNDFDPDEEDSLVSDIITGPSNGTLVDNGDGTYTYTPNDGYIGTDYIAYTACDDGEPSLCDTAYVTITIETPVIDAEPDIVFTPIDTPLDIAVMDNDIGIGITVVAIVTEPENGTATITNPDAGIINYTPNTGFQGTDYFEYEICDAAGNCDVTLVTVVVLDTLITPNIAPNAVNDIVNIAIDEVVVIDVLANDNDPFCGDELTIIDNTDPVNGTIELVDGMFTYTPDAGFAGIDSFSYTIEDNCPEDPLTDVALVVINVGDDVAPNEEPIAADDELTLECDGEVVIDVLANDNDPDGGTLTIVAVSEPQGEVVINDDGTLTYYAPEEDCDGDDFFYYIICDDGIPVLCDTAYVNITLESSLDAEPDIAFTSENEEVIIDVLLNDTGDGLEVTQITLVPINGSVINNGTDVTYVPNPDFVGTDYFMYEVCDENDNCEITLVTVIILPDTIPNIVPNAVNDMDTTPVNVPLVVDVLFNDNDPFCSGDLEIINFDIETANDGTITLSGDTALLYTPASGFIGIDTFIYTITDNCPGDPLTATATVTIAVGIGNYPNGFPIATDDLAEVGCNEEVTIYMLENDFDTNGDEIHIVWVSEPLGGLVFNADSTSAVYSPSGEDTLDFFSYIICDEGNPFLCDTAFVTINIAECISTIDAEPDIAFTSLNTPVEIPVLLNDLGIGIELTAIVSEPDFGTLIINDDGTITYTPEDGFLGTDYFEYQICDENGDCDITLVTIIVMEDSIDNIAPNAVNDMATTPIDTPLEIDVLANDNDPFCGEDLVITNFTEPANGDLLLTADNTFIYQPNDGFVGLDSFSYVIFDDCPDGPLSDTALVVINVGSDELPNNYPIAVDDTTSTTEGVAIDIDILANDIDPDGDGLIVTFISEPCGDAVLNPDMTVTYTPLEDCGDTDYFTYIICDAGFPELCDTAYVTIYITADSTADVSTTTPEDTPIELCIEAFMDLDFEVDSVYVVEFPANGTIIPDEESDTCLVYVPNPNWCGTDMFIMAACDEDGNCEEFVFEIEVVCVPDAPIAVDDLVQTEIGESVTIDILSNDYDPDDADNPDAISLVDIIDDTNNGVTVINADGTVTYVPDQSFFGCDTFTYVIEDVDEMTDTAIAVICVEAGPTDIIAVDDFVTIEEVTIVEIDILDNDAYYDDGDLTTLTITIITDPLGGTVTVNTLGGDDISVHYEPIPNEFTGVDSFQYEICNFVQDLDTTVCDQAWVYITLDGPPSCDLVFATGFSPNGDGIADQYEIENLQFISECYPNAAPEMQIFNRWGDVVYTRDNYNNMQGWDGTWYTSNEPVPDGTYFYIFKLDPDNDETWATGYIEVRR